MTTLDSRVNTTNKEIPDGGIPVPDGLYDVRMGVPEYTWFCGTCGNSKAECPGHSGIPLIKN